MRIRIVKQKQNYINSLFKTFDILLAFTPEKQELSLTEIVKETKLNKTTVYRFLSSLIAIGIIHKNQNNNKYQLGITLYELGNRVNIKNNLVDIAHPYLVKLVRDIDITIHFATLDGGEVLYLDKIKSRKTFQMNTYIGARAPAYCTALGKSMLAYLDEEMLEHHFGSIKFNKLTPYTLDNSAELLKQLKKIRKNGFAIDKEEFEEGLHCLAVPVIDTNDYPIASLSISGTPFEISEKKIRSLQKKLTETTKKIAKELELRKFTKSNLNNE